MSDASLKPPHLRDPYTTVRHFDSTFLIEFDDDDNRVIVKPLYEPTTLSELADLADALADQGELVFVHNFVTYGVRVYEADGITMWGLFMYPAHYFATVLGNPDSYWEDALLVDRRGSEPGPAHENLTGLLYSLTRNP